MAPRFSEKIGVQSDFATGHHMKAPSAPRPPHQHTKVLAKYTDLTVMAKKNGGTKSFSDHSASCAALHAAFKEHVKQLHSLRQLTTPNRQQEVTITSGMRRIRESLKNTITEWNRPLDANFLDLHFSTSEMAMAMAAEKMAAFFDANETANGTLTIITGAGKHSMNGVNVIRDAILGHLERNKNALQFVEASPGCIRVQRKFR